MTGHPREMYMLGSFLVQAKKHREGILLLKSVKNRILSQLKKDHTFSYALVCSNLITAYSEIGDLNSAYREQHGFDKNHHLFKKL